MRSVSHLEPLTGKCWECATRGSQDARLIEQASNPRAWPPNPGTDSRPCDVALNSRVAWKTPTDAVCINATFVALCPYCNMLQNSECVVGAGCVHSMLRHVQV